MTSERLVPRTQLIEGTSVFFDHANFLWKGDPYLQMYSEIISLSHYGL